MITLAPISSIFTMPSVTFRLLQVHSLAREMPVGDTSVPVPVNVRAGDTVRAAKFELFREGGEIENERNPSQSLASSTVFPGITYQQRLFYRGRLVREGGGAATLKECADAINAEASIQNGGGERASIDFEVCAGTNCPACRAHEFAAALEAKARPGEPKAKVVVTRNGVGSLPR